MKFKIDNDFIPILESVFEIEILNKHQGSIIGLWDDKSIAYLNPAWFSFYDSNSTNPKSPISDIGDSYIDSIPNILKDFYLNLFQQSLNHMQENKVISHNYECSSPSHFREFNMQIFPITYLMDSNTPGKGGKVSFLLMHSLVVEIPIENKYKSKQAYKLDDYKNTDNIIVQCSHCRRVKSQIDQTQWDWVTELVRKSDPDTSHGLCKICLEYFYPKKLELST